MAMARAYDNQPSYDQHHYNSGAQSLQQQPIKPIIPIIKSDFQQHNDGSYQYQYETGNGIQAAENGYVKNGGHADNQIQVAEGYFHYTGEDGIPISLKYIADENGFQPIVSYIKIKILRKILRISMFVQGDHLPTPPPLPKEILEAYEKIAADPRQNDGDDGQYRKEQHSSGQYSQYQSQQYHSGQEQGHYKYQEITDKWLTLFISIKKFQKN